MDRKTERQKNRKTERQKERKTKRKKGRKKGRKTGRKKDRRRTVKTEGQKESKMLRESGKIIFCDCVTRMSNFLKKKVEAPSPVVGSGPRGTDIPSVGRCCRTQATPPPPPLQPKTRWYLRFQN